MIKKQAAMLSGSLILALIFLTGASLGCRMFGGGSSSNINDSVKTMKGIPADKICTALAHPNFESRFPYDGQGCSGSTYFGVRDTRTASYESDTRPAFSYGAIGEQGVITKIHLSMTKRPDGAQLFLAEAQSVARMINNQPLPKEIEDAINSAPPMSGDFTTTSQIGNAKVEMVRSSADNRFRLSFEF